MKKHLLTALPLMLVFGVGVAVAEDPVCLDCHEVDDFQGMTVEEITITARDPDNEDHADNSNLTDEELVIIVESLQTTE